MELLSSAEFQQHRISWVTPLLGAPQHIFTPPSKDHPQNEFVWCVLVHDTSWCTEHSSSPPAIIAEPSIFKQAKDCTMGLSENRVYSQWNSHLIGIMISKTIGFRGTPHFQTHPNRIVCSPWNRHGVRRRLANSVALCCTSSLNIFPTRYETRWLSCPSCLLRVEDSHPTRVRPQRTLSFEGNHLAPLFQLKFVGNHVHLGLLQWSWMWVNYKRWATSRLSLAFGQVCWMSLFWSGLYIYILRLYMYNILVPRNSGRGDKGTRCTSKIGNKNTSQIR